MDISDVLSAYIPIPSAALICIICMDISIVLWVNVIWGYLIYLCKSGNSFLILQKNIMETPTSFKVNHLILEPGVYLRDADEKRGVFTYDIRLVKPTLAYREAITPQMSHTMEHWLAHYLRTMSTIQSEIVYVGPMGCLTGFYILTYTKYTESDMRDIMVLALESMLTIDVIPGAKAEECGNYTLFDLESTKRRIPEFIKLLKKQ